MPSMSSIDACRRHFSLSGRRNPPPEAVERCALIIEDVGTRMTYSEAVEELKKLGMGQDEAHRLVKLASRRLV